jgi:hypothetical protein
MNASGIGTGAYETLGGRLDAPARRASAPASAPYADPRGARRK